MRDFHPHYITWKIISVGLTKQAQKLENFVIRELLFADDAATVAHTLEYTREICKQFEQAATLFGLKINTKEIVMLYQPQTEQTSIDPHVEIYGMPLKSVKNCTYVPGQHCCIRQRH